MPNSKMLWTARRHDISSKFDTILTHGVMALKYPPCLRNNEREKSSALYFPIAACGSMGEKS